MNVPAVLPAKPTLDDVKKIAGPYDEIEETPEGEFIVHVNRKKERPIQTEGGLSAIDATERHINQIAHGFIMGSQSLKSNADVRRKLEERVTKRIGTKGKFLVDRLFELAAGVYVLDKVAGKEVRYYKVPPDFRALVYLLDRVLGKPKQTMETSDAKKGIYVVESIIKNLATPGQPPVIGVKSRVAEQSDG